MSEIQNYNQNKNILESKAPHARFFDRLQRWHGISFDEETLKEMHVTFERSFIQDDFNYCEKVLIEDGQIKFKINPADIFKICRSSKLKRMKNQREEEESKERRKPINKEGRARVKGYLTKMKEALGLDTEKLNK